ncbi:hypothetical protein [Leptolyngbya sp. FACHB-261]|uniref:hypothetical protein n=1 Tax=Leptolyngbya sp. FACHB-261 TaxID=2692806 RepID=UPI0016843F48|nr:hypothetical protein [Leptolyngbya sp. FACHB-261]MBD2101952.1 hypothetical protein [Leptolyngbya sp. FACHB-261]
MNKGTALLSRIVILVVDSVSLARQELNATIQRRFGQRKALPPSDERDRRY